MTVLLVTSNSTFQKLGFCILLADGRKIQILLWTIWNALLVQAMKDVSLKLFREFNLEAVFKMFFLNVMISITNKT